MVHKEYLLRMRRRIQDILLQFRHIDLIDRNTLESDSLGAILKML